MEHIPSSKCSVEAPAKCKISIYVLMEICLQWSKWLEPKSTLKPLQWNSFEELQQISESKMSSDLRKWQIIPEFPFCNEIAKLYTTAKEFDNSGDEEQAFIWYYKYCEFEKLHDDEYQIKNVWKCSCGLDCSHCDIFHQQASLKTSKKQLKILTKSLKNRYEIEEIVENLNE